MNEDLFFSLDDQMRKLFSRPEPSTEEIQEAVKKYAVDALN